MVGLKEAGFFCVKWSNWCLVPEFVSGICWNVIIGAYTGNNSTVDWILHSRLCMLKLE